MIVHVIHKSVFKLLASKVNMQAFMTTQAQAVLNDQLCTQWQQSHFVSQANSKSHSVFVPPYLTWCLYLSHNFSLYLSRASRVYQQASDCCLVRTKENRGKQNGAELLMRPESVLRKSVIISLYMHTRCTCATNVPSMLIAGESKVSETQIHTLAWQN